jgi:hypothetical protein
MNLQAYANHRKAQGLKGVSHVAVLNAIKDGRLTDPAVKREGRNWVINPTLADQQWSDRTTPGERGAMGVGKAYAQPHQAPASRKGIPPLAVSKEIKAAIDAQMAQLELQQLQNLLVYREDMEQAYSAVLANMMARAYAAAKQIKLQIPHITIEEMNRIEKIVLDVFEETSQDDFEELPE